MCVVLVASCHHGASWSYETGGAQRFERVVARFAATLLAVGLSVAGSVAAGCMCLDFFKPLLIGQCFGHVADDGWDGLMAQGVGARRSSKCGHVKIKS